MRDFIDKTPTSNGTSLNRDNLMAMQGFDKNTVVFTENSIVETNGLGQTKTTTFNDDGTITEKFVGEKTITKKITFNSHGSISEELI